MKTEVQTWLIGSLAALVVVVAGGWSLRAALAAPPAAPVDAPARGLVTGPVAQEAPDAAAGPAAGEALILSYTAKFVCTEALQPGVFWYGPVAPLVHQHTDVLVHNPTGFPVTLYKKAVIAPLEKFDGVEQGTAPGRWKRVVLQPDYAFHIDCDDITKLLTGKPDATFLGEYGVGKTVEGFVVVGIGRQPVATGQVRYGQLDVTAEYVRGSEVMKKDIHYQPWWRWWWYPLPWRLGYAYERVVPYQPDHNIDCRGALYTALAADVDREMTNSTQREAVHQALKAGQDIDPTSILQQTAGSPAALVALIGRCDKIDQQVMAVDYVLVSNKGPTEAGAGGSPQLSAAVRYPWLPGRWYDLAVVVPQNLDVDLDQFFHDWQVQRWVGAGASEADAKAALVYYFPYWCGWGDWYGWRPSDCVEIGVGEGESLDVEAITPVRVFMPQWPPATE